MFLTTRGLISRASAAYDVLGRLGASVAISTLWLNSGPLNSLSPKGIIRASLAVLSASSDGGGGVGDGERSGSVKTTWEASASRRLASSDQTLASYNENMSL